MTTDEVDQLARDMADQGDKHAWEYQMARRLVWLLDTLKDRESERDD